jgi:GntR family transcriptional regulator, arabinose operon transcriptional repressor
VSIDLPRQYPTLLRDGQSVGTLDKGASAKALYTQLIDHLRERILDGRLPPGSRLPTELDLARELQISRGTVRQALSALESEGLLERAQRRGTFVRLAPTATTLVRQAAERRIGLILNRLGNELDIDIMLGVEHIAKSRGYQVSFAYAEERVAEQSRDIDRLRADRVAGMIIFPVSDITNDASIYQLQSSGMPLVLVDRYLPDLDTDYVVPDNTGGGYRATEHLIILGHTRIGFVYGSIGTLTTTSVRDRYEGYRKALRTYNLPEDEALVAQLPPFYIPDAARQYDAFLSLPDRPSAIFAVNDDIALQLIQSAQRLGIRLPEDLAIVGFDDLSFAAHLSPPLTTVAQPRMDVGMRAGNLLINRIEGRDGPKQHIELPTSLVVRASCGARLLARRSA